MALPEAVANGKTATSVAETLAPPAARPEAVPNGKAAEELPAVETDATAPSEVDVAIEAAAPAEFRDLLGQAVGLRLDAVSKEFGGHDLSVAALREVSLEVAPGEFVSILGPSGCGKTTLLSLVGGLDQPTSGRVFAAGLALDQLPEIALADYRLQRVGTIFQSFNLVPSMTVEDNVALPLALAGVRPEERRRRARRLLELVGLEGRATVRASRLSGGEQQKAAVARALANRPGLILADEPTGSLDSAAGEVILQLLRDLNRRGATVLLVTHDPDVARHAKREVRMIDGRAVEHGDSGGKNVRNQDPVEPPTRLHWRDTLQLGLSSTGRRPLRTALATTGVAIGIAAMSLIVALAGGLQNALNAPALQQSALHQVTVQPLSNQGVGAFSGGTLTTLAALPHVRAAWGEVALSGAFSKSPLSGAAVASPVPTPGPNPSASPAPTLTPAGALVSLPPVAQEGTNLTVIFGRLPRTDLANEVVLAESTAVSLGFADPASAVGRRIDFDASSGSLALTGTNVDPVTAHSTLHLLVVGIVANQMMPAGVSGGLAPYGLTSTYWGSLANANGWKNGRYTSITLLADSGANVDSLRNSVAVLGFQAQTFGDQFRGFEELLRRLRLALIGLAAVALVLAGLGIANTMYSAVLERTKEIGVLKAVGARSRDVLLLFVSEAAVIGLVGGIVGTLVAGSLAQVGNRLVDLISQGVASAGVEVFRPDLLVAIGALFVAIALSTASGLLPAMRAARQEPVSALRYE